VPSVRDADFRLKLFYVFNLDPVGIGTYPVYQILLSQGAQKDKSIRKSEN